MAELASVNTETFEQEVLNASQPVLVDFTATWCGPCKALAPALSDMAAMYDGAVRIVKLDIDESASLAEKYGVRGVPTLMLFQGGEPTLYKGMNTRSGIAAFLDKATEDAQ
ncbi:thioredoxin [Sphingobium sp. H39-3-25]|uniref:thioredoxin family protein n=1 Tax=Sphingobium arseniciresistens TaxID=3030834 RepID=UPI0023BA2A5A|nr:thioredoxin [Sphingobium arseniciresistens]